MAIGYINLTKEQSFWLKEDGSAWLDEKVQINRTYTHSRKWNEEVYFDNQEEGLVSILYPNMEAALNAIQPDEIGEYDGPGDFDLDKIEWEN